ncbi:MAG: hypothetical protein CVV42_16920 [Candidatus Riflebacteria bacterium HGW-Riflebacteria-2]|nr:MAG: hypothetical protein CVV42_16920 [Candidatus Riflebacteria bacterium HGW-Riflebacteria-2]
MKKTLGLACLILALLVAVPQLMAAETMGLYLNGKGIGNADTRFDTIAWSFTRPGYFNVQIFFGNKDIKKKSDEKSADNQFFLEITPEQYNRIFEGNVDVVNMPVNDGIWSRSVSTKVMRGRRIVRITFTNAIDDEITEVFKKGFLEMFIAENEIQAMKMMIERKRFMSIGGYKTVFMAEARRLKKVANGLSLVDEGELGRVSTDAAIANALATKNNNSFMAAIKSEQRRRK